MNCAEDPFNMGMFYNSKCHSKWVCFQIPNTHIWASLYWSRPPGVQLHLVAGVRGAQISILCCRAILQKCPQFSKCSTKLKLGKN